VGCRAARLGRGGAGMSDFSEHLTKRYDTITAQISELGGARDRVADLLETMDYRLIELKQIQAFVIEKLAEPAGKDA